MAATNRYDAYSTGTQPVAQRMGEVASNFLAALSTDQRAKAIFDFADQDERTRWFYTPNERNGLCLKEMERPQRRFAYQLISTGLSQAGYTTATTIMGLEATLDAFEGWKPDGNDRDPIRYYVSIFGSPSSTEPWGWRFEGHHVSVNYTIAGGRIIAPTPTFFGANPAESPLSGTQTLRPLGGIEDLARELVHALDEEQRARAILSPAAPPDIILGNRPQVEDDALPLTVSVGLPLTQNVSDRHEERLRQLGVTDQHLDALRYTTAPKGLGAARLSSAQREILTLLVREYIGRMPDEIADIELAQLEQQGIESLHFAWAGGIERRQPHYYRLQGSRFLVEYDNTQNDVNHIHSVWRQPGNDFGADLLARHYAHSPHHHPH